ncbi:MFS transporter [Fluviispira multicolorata]|uniref:MFS transporter n=1 Tax=Fluviispira multicolorata TaxID=2654512 RepID=A0A833JE75_9BACT|nr:MFS transporter [Fluviispira multicolorata]KAB8032250.1 MFS transporter [Fluviispira multicolorata]
MYAVTNQNKNKIFVVIAVAFAMFVDAMSYGIVVPLLPVYADKILNLSNTMTSLFVAIYAVGLLISVPFVNLLTQKIGNKLTLILGGFLLFFSLILFPFGNSIEILFFARFLQGASAAITWTAGLSLVAQNVHPQKRSTALGTVMVGVSVGHLLGAPFAGFLYEFGGILLPFLGVSIFALLSLSLFFMLKDKNEVIVDINKYNNFDFFKLIAKNNILFGLCGVVLIESFMISMLEPTLALYASRQFNASSVTIGLLFGVQVLTLGLFSPIVGKLADKYGKLKMIVIGMFSCGVIFLSIASTQSIFSIFFLMSLLGVSSAFFMSPVLSAFADEIDKSEMKGLYHIAYGIFNLIYSLGMILGPTAGGFMTEIWSENASFAVIGVILLTTVPLFIFSISLKKKTYTAQPSAKAPVHLAEKSQSKIQDFSPIA